MEVNRFLCFEKKKKISETEAMFIGRPGHARIRGVCPSGEGGVETGT